MVGHSLTKDPKWNGKGKPVVLRLKNYPDF